jgi:hypothetical protein
MNTQADPLTEAAFRAQLTGAGLHLAEADVAVALVGAQRLRVQIAVLAAYLAERPESDGAA